MSRVSRKQRFAMLAATVTLAAGGALLPSGAFAAPAAPHTQAVAAAEAGNHHTDQNKVTTIIKTSTKTNTKHLRGGKLQITITKTTAVIKIKDGDVISKKVTVVKRQKIVDIDFQDNNRVRNEGNIDDE
ncbi:hypothetical protein JK361_30290 [Streptomyces sp. 5-8]|uniref:DUF5666 domain-containing protein n=1 Tax=Streptomyces musisoli TaxID=2802280 RepID=A0ABS1P985_9ACTN|nr:hypothetical protein [Streptomyces musisoli]MBL1108824.1 hypothetical protein [Streptomyces musisoli]